MKNLNLNDLIASSYSHVVGINPKTDGTADLFCRAGDSVSVTNIPYKPFVLLAHDQLLADFEGNVEIKPLQIAGTAAFTCIAEFADSQNYDDGLKHLKSSTGFNPSAANAPYMVISDLQQQLFIQHKFRLFRDMTYADLRRMQFDIETVTTEGYEFPNAKRENDRIVIISLSDNTGWELSLNCNEMSEKELLESFVRVVNERDPDVLEGHNIFRFDLPFIQERAKRHKVKLTLGRDGSVCKSRNSRFSAAERTINFTRFDTVGRHFVDTLHLVQLYDVSHRDLEEYGLKAVAKHFGVAAPERTYIEGHNISAAWENDRETLLKYALDDVRETRAIGNILGPSYFYQTQLLPISYQNCVVRGNATRIDGLLTAEYLAKDTALPAQEMNRSFQGALTKAFDAGVFKNVWHCDVRSLYPSIIISDKLCPVRDVLGVYPVILEKLRQFRLNAKDAERQAADNAEKDFYNSLQTTFKILINSFYGYLGFAQGRFNDFEMAEKVTAKGREILTTMLEYLQNTGAVVIEMDTDGIYFQPPKGIESTEEMENKIQNVLPEGIDVELDSTYAAMFSYKSKNYALLSNNGEIAMKGAALKSRGLEPFQREYIKEFISMLLHEKANEIEDMTEAYRTAIENRKWDLAKFAKTENINDSLETYKRKMSSGKGRRSASYELAIQSGRDYRQGDQISYYVTGDKKRVSVVENSQLLADAPEQRNENVLYYLNKLEDLQKKFIDFIPDNSSSNELGLDFGD